MSLTNPNKPVTEARLQEFYHRIKNFLGFTEMPSEDINKIVSPLPSVKPRYQKYSTEEQIIGEWIDGKPIYQKVVTGLNIELSWQGQYHASGNMASPIADIDKLIFAYAIASSGNIVSGAIKIVSNILDIVSVDAYTITTLVAQYTKTTD